MPNDPLADTSDIEMEAGHDAMVTSSKALAKILLELC